MLSMGISIYRPLYDTILYQYVASPCIVGLRPHINSNRMNDYIYGKWYL